METVAELELAAPLEILPPVDFCCAYGSSLLPNNSDKATMVDYILGVSDPVQWHSENLERNRQHYSSCMARLGPKVITQLSDVVGAGVHFNPFVEWRNKRIKYGVVRMHDLAMDVLSWNRFYLSGRLQKPEFSEDDLYAKICSLSYLGDLRMLFAEDKNKVKNIVEGSFKLFQSMYGPLLHDYLSERLLRISSIGGTKTYKQDCSSSSTNYLFSTLPWTIQKHAGGNSTLSHDGPTSTRIIISSKDMAAKCVKRGLRRLVMTSSVRQALSGLIATGGLNAAKYLGRKMSKAWQSRIS